MDIKTVLELNYNKNITCADLWDIGKIVLKKEFILDINIRLSVILQLKKGNL